MKPKSNFATLLENSVNYVNARCSMPSDSFPGTAALYTGALPRTHGLWYDNTWSRDLFPYSAHCSGTPGFNVLNDETIDANDTLLNGGGAFDTTHLSWTKTSWGGCSYLLPHNFIRSSTIFEVVRNNGGFTKVAEKHPAYEMLNGPSGTGIYVCPGCSRADMRKDFSLKLQQSIPLSLLLKLTMTYIGMRFITGQSEIL